MDFNKIIKDSIFAFFFRQLLKFPTNNYNEYESFSHFMEKNVIYIKEYHFQRKVFVL